MTPSTHLRLPLRFDTARMQAELDAIGADAWIAHFNTGAYDNGWSCVPLRSAGGNARHIMPVDGEPYRDTAILQRCPRLRQVIDSFACDKLSVRLMALAPGAMIREHRDPGTALQDGLTRLHVPIQTSPEVLFTIDGESVHFSAGHAWYLDASCRHAVHNASALPRVHLMIDCVSNDWLAQLFKEAGFIPRAAPSLSRNNALSARERLLLRAEAVAWHAGMPMRHWFPVTIAGTPPQLAWRHAAGQRFTDPFFDNTLARQVPQQRQRCDTPAAALGAVGPTLAPDAFIFHVSRCGSTLLTQLLAALPQCVVMSEPPVIDALLRRHHDEAAAAHDTAALLRQVVLALGQHRFAGEAHFFVKLDCWHIHSLALVRLAFPDTPCLFLYREPGAVLASHRRQRGPQMVPGLLHPALLPPAPASLAPGDLDGYAAQVLAGFFEAAAAAVQAGALELLNYADLPALVADTLLARFGIACTAQQGEQLRQRAGFHSKHAGAPFGGDPAGAAAADDQLSRLYQILEMHRRRTASNLQCSFSVKNVHLGNKTM
ncbi:aspartyl/asparaginyl beta-hydroxylase domain-containing protein [Massilia sp. DJPM01]|uniref:aspartyl/asparaginyl beta-hydroxylase domain-containing protein n=1 Tax=Massilia sp. DJPM01 TaxID=3024404 RepID=UPI00259FC6B2|nr:aspartyl/asparaginyl beta-hydroxylase domain-containing protein [Massilia sp. DJPM01]MDM5179577.1 aspartyl/asparaginyl beta-hydroxylase domain-containing protein [Massilia sp. DJPM01]